MRYLPWICRPCKLALFAVAGWLALHGAALAAPVAEEAEQKSDGGGSYLLSYALTGAGIVLGLLFVCRTSRRRDRARPEQFGETKVVKE
jgi:hypothetical protein